MPLIILNTDCFWWTQKSCLKVTKFLPREVPKLFATKKIINMRQEGLVQVPTLKQFNQEKRFFRQDIHAGIIFRFLKEQMTILIQSH